MKIAVTRRKVPAPESEWLSEAEVRVALGEISERTLDRYIAAGKFPRSTIFAGDARWHWKDLAWYWLGKELQAKLKGHAEAEEDAAEPTPERQQGDKRRQTSTQA
jgi:hypothetical protein